MLPATHWIEKDGSFTNSGRWMQWKDAGAAAGGRGPPRPLDPGRALPAGAEALPAAGRQVPGAAAGARPCRTRIRRKPELDEIAQEINGFDLTTGKRLRLVRQAQGRRHDDRRRLDLHRALPGGRQPVQAPRRRSRTRRRTTRPAWATTTNWAWSWPLNRRVCTTARRPTSRAGPGIRRGRASQWDATARRSGSATCPTTRRRSIRTDPEAWVPFIMNGEGVGRLFSQLDAATGRSPSTTSRSSRRSTNPLHPNAVGVAGRVPLRQGGRAARTGSAP